MRECVIFNKIFLTSLIVSAHSENRFPVPVLASVGGIFRPRHWVGSFGPATGRLGYVTGRSGRSCSILPVRVRTGPLNKSCIHTLPHPLELYATC